jgi:hypothetical protein
MNHHLTTLTLLTHVSRFNSLCKLDECNSLFLTLTFIYLYLSYQSQQCKQLRLLYFQALLSQIHIKLIIHAFIYSFCSNKFITAILLLLHRGGVGDVGACAVTRGRVETYNIWWGTDWRWRLKIRYNQSLRCWSRQEKRKESWPWELSLL